MTRYIVLRYIFGRYVVVHSYGTRCYGRATTTVIVCRLGILGLAWVLPGYCLGIAWVLPGPNLGRIRVASGLDQGLACIQWVS